MDIFAWVIRHVWEMLGKRNFPTILLFLGDIDPSTSFLWQEKYAIAKRIFFSARPSVGVAASERRANVTFKTIIEPEISLSKEIFVSFVGF